jgi:hypothetical protein
MKPNALDVAEDLQRLAAVLERQGWAPRPELARAIAFLTAESPPRPPTPSRSPRPSTTSHERARLRLLGLLARHEHPLSVGFITRSVHFTHKTIELHMKECVDEKLVIDKGMGVAWSLTSAGRAYYEAHQTAPVEHS